MASSSEVNPVVDVQISFDRQTHSYSHTEPPKVSLTITSRAQHPITVYTWRTPLDPLGALTNRGYLITDQTTGQLVNTTTISCIYRGPTFRLKGGRDEPDFLTLIPDIPVERSTGMLRTNIFLPPAPAYPALRCF